LTREIQITKFKKYLKALLLKISSIQKKTSIHLYKFQYQLFIKKKTEKYPDIFLKNNIYKTAKKAKHFSYIFKFFF